MALVDESVDDARGQQRLAAELPAAPPKKPKVEQPDEAEERNSGSSRCCSPVTFQRVSTSSASLDRVRRGAGGDYIPFTSANSGGGGGGGVGLPPPPAAHSHHVPMPHPGCDPGWLYMMCQYAAAAACAGLPAPPPPPPPPPPQPTAMFVPPPFLVPGKPDTKFFPPFPHSAAASAYAFPASSGAFAYPGAHYYPHHHQHHTGAGGGGSATSPGPPVLLNPERVVPSSSDADRFPPHFQPNVSLAPLPPSDSAASASYSQFRRSRLMSASRPASPPEYEKVSSPGLLVKREPLEEGCLEERIRSTLGMMPSSQADAVVNKFLRLAEEVRADAMADAIRAEAEAREKDVAELRRQLSSQQEMLTELRERNLKLEAELAASRGGHFAERMGTKSKSPLLNGTKSTSPRSCSSLSSSSSSSSPPAAADVKPPNLLIIAADTN
ncbi:unnamed protein product [Notodromas monacha]|uniref:Uncharacterized protein n=1 Tax=Notodromas monacha TaxID=399045 RepID=A0A7R9GHA0_9CRUS|nr:unnamed protein product [Notodromas monacha]CAG0920699.1 unnamed protein product [Notodromas monacha]